MADSQKQCIVFTGISKSVEFDNFKKQVREKLNADILQSVTNRVSLLVYKVNEKNDEKKIEKAKKSGIECVPLDEFIEAHKLEFRQIKIENIKKPKQSFNEKKEDYIQSSDSDEDNLVKKSLLGAIENIKKEIKFYSNSIENLNEIIKRYTDNIKDQNIHLQSLTDKLKEI